MNARITENRLHRAWKIKAIDEDATLPFSHSESRYRLQLPLVIGLLFALLLFSLVPTFATASDKTTGRVVVPDNAGNAYELYSGSYALLLGVWDYESIGRLSQIPDELDSVARALETHGFDVTLAYPENKRELKLVADDFIDKYGHNDKNRILFFYSGHGFSYQDKGYLLMRDAQPVVLENEKDLLSEDFHRTALTMNQVMTWATDMQAKHAMFMFDSCFAGTIFGTRTIRQPLSAVDFNVDAVNHQARLFITAGSATEEVPAKSDFVPSFVETISKQGTEADINRDGYVTGDEIGLYIKDSIQRLGRQTPQVGKYPPQYSKGDIVFEITPWQPKKPASIEFSIDGVELSIRGMVRSQLEKEQILSSAEQAFGIENIQFDSFKATHDVGRASWLNGVIQSIHGLRYLEHGELRVSESELYVDGVVNHENKKKRLIASLNSSPSLAGLSLSETVSIVPMQTAELRYTVNDSEVVVDGSLQASVAKNQIVNAVRRSFGENTTVTDKIVVGENTVSANWIAAVIEANQVLTSIRQGEFRIDSEDIRVSGGIGSAEDLSLLEYVLKQNFPKHSIDINLQIEARKIPEIRFQLDKDRVQITGYLSSKTDISEIMSSASKLFGADNIDIDIVESKEYKESAWVNAAPEILNSISPLMTGSMKVSDEYVEIEGIVNNDREKQLVLESLQKYLSDKHLVRDNIAIASNPKKSNTDTVLRTSEVRCRFDNGQIVLNGVLPDSKDADRFVSTAKIIFGKHNVENLITIDEHATSARSWLNKTAKVLTHLRKVETGILTVNDTSSTLSGVVPDENTRLLVRISMRTLLHGNVSLDNIVVAPSLQSNSANVAVKGPVDSDKNSNMVAATNVMPTDYCAVFRPDRHVVKKSSARLKAGFRVRDQPHSRCDTWLGLTPAAKVSVTAQYGNWSYIVVADSALRGWVYKEAFDNKGFFKRMFGNNDTR